MAACNQPNTIKRRYALRKWRSKLTSGGTYLPAMLSNNMAGRLGCIGATMGSSLNVNLQYNRKPLRHVDDKLWRNTRSVAA